MKYSTGVIISQVDKKGSNIAFLCLRAYALWDFPKGEVELGEDIKQTAVREVREETNLIHDVDFQMTNQTAPSITYGSGKRKKTATYFLARRLSTKTPTLPIQPELGKAEHEEYRWVQLSDLRETMPKRFEPIIIFLENYYRKTQDGDI
jgi:8-oxo-dGTP pyrophosphatase MutT (NUDIX family)